MSATNTMAAAILSLYFTNEDHTGIGDAAGLLGSTVPGSFYLSLHTADPTGTGLQTTSEATYTSYARISVVRSTSGWTVTTADPATCKNDAVLSFPAATGGTEEITHVGIGSDASGVGTLHFTAALTSALTVSNGITPELAINALSVNAT